MRAEGYSTLDELQAHYTGSDDSMSPLNYVWFQYRWQRLAAKLFEVDGEDGRALPAQYVRAPPYRSRAKQESGLAKLQADTKSTSFLANKQHTNITSRGRAATVRWPTREPRKGVTRSQRSC
jgi:hypothetical protein